MEKKLVLKDEHTQMYFTRDYECFWSRDIRDAYFFNTLEKAEEAILIMLADTFQEPLKGVHYIEVVTFYCL